MLRRSPLTSKFFPKVNFSSTAKIPSSSFITLVAPQYQLRFNSSTSTTTISIINKKIQLEDGRCYDGPFDSVTGVPTTGCKLTDGNDYYVGEYNSSWQRHGKGKAVLDGGSTTEEGTFFEDDFVEGTVTTIDENGDRVIFKGTLHENQFKHGTLKHKEFLHWQF
jgi:hypothetical protein